ncbi:MAG TPA: Nif3-like dinuclear metal center hexameric protein [Lacipirellulaceae bacterium]|nr:Nif3-like dinuclear metal center hexameric protein [Lacipirellulaceae bacterium]
MPTVGQVAEVLEQLAPLALAEEWDNVGLLVGDVDWPADRVMTCLTVTPETVAEAITSQAQLIVSHHPLPFRPIKSVTSATTPGRLLLQLIRSSIAVYSPHTAFDSASAGINQHLAIGLGLHEISPLAPSAGDAEVGVGRYGLAGEPLTLGELAQRTKEFLGADAVRIVGESDQAVDRVAIACGSGGSLLEAAIAAGCDALVTGELTFHACLEAEARDVSIVLAGHFASERFALLSLADYLTDQLAGVQVWPSRAERDPLRLA